MDPVGILNIGQGQPRVPEVLANPSNLPRKAPLPKGPCAQPVYTLALKYSLYRYIGPKVSTLWVHGRLGPSTQRRAFRGSSGHGCQGVVRIPRWCWICSSKSLATLCGAWGPGS